MKLQHWLWWADAVRTSGLPTLTWLHVAGTAISRDSVAEVLIEALLQPAADNRVIEIVASSAEPSVPPQDWFR